MLVNDRKKASHSFTTMQLLRRLKPKPKGPHRLGGLSPEILSLIIEHFCTNDLRDLVNLSLVSRGLYLFVASYLYREVRIDVGRASHNRLLQRLAGPNCRLAEKIRTLGITDTERDLTIRWDCLATLLTRLKYLREFDWNGPIALPYYLLEMIASQHPQAHLNISVWKPIPRHRSNVGRLNGHVLAHRIGLQINTFVYRYHGVQRLTAGFKENLVAWLASKQTLMTLAIFNEDPEDIEALPQRLELFRNSSFPCIDELLLHTTIFTCGELQLWASRGKWDKLSLLHLHNIHQLRHFIGLAPQLEHLSFHFDYRIDTSDDEAKLVKLLKANPLSQLLHVSYSGQAQFTPQPLSHTRRAVPFIILESNPKLRRLHLTRELDCPRGVRKLFTPTAEEIRRVRILCPDLQVLKLNVDLSAITSECAAVFAELSLFKNPIVLVLYMRLQFFHSKRYGKFCRMCKILFDTVVKERRDLGLPCQRPFRMQFLAMRIDRHSEAEWVQSNCTFQLSDSGASFQCGNIPENRKKLDLLSMEQLRDKSRIQPLLNRIWDLKGYKKEIQRRERYKYIEHGFAEDFTLHNLWA